MSWALDPSYSLLLCATVPFWIKYHEFQKPGSTFPETQPVLSMTGGVQDGFLYLADSAVVYAIQKVITFIAILWHCWPMLSLLFTLISPFLHAQWAGIPKGNTTDIGRQQPVQQLAQKDVCPVCPGARKAGKDVHLPELLAGQFSCVFLPQVCHGVCLRCTPRLSREWGRCEKHLVEL